MTDETGEPIARPGAGMPAAGSSESGAGSETGAGGRQPDLLAEVRTLRRQARAARHAYWFPLVLFGLLTCGAIPFYVEPTATQVRPGIFIIYSHGISLPFLGDGAETRSYLGYYWVVALLGGLLLTQLWYRWHARQVGLATRSRAYLIVTAVLVAAALVIPLVVRVTYLGDPFIRGTSPFLIIAAGLLVLAWSERSRGLGIAAVVYTGAALLASLYSVSNLTSRVGWYPGRAADALPNVVLPAAVLLVAGAIAYIGQRRPRRVAAP